MKADRSSNSPVSRARSPVTLNKNVNEKSEIYRQAMDKLFEASWKFDRGKNGDFLKVSVDNVIILISNLNQ